jgi:hypothetical protein
MHRRSSNRLLPAEPPAGVDPSGAFVVDEPELEEQAIAAPTSSETASHLQGPAWPRLHSWFDYKQPASH